MHKLKLLVLLVSTLGASAALADARLASADLEPKYAVGMVTNFVRDYGKPFDTWGRKYKNDRYRALLDQIEALGTPRTTVTNIYYPSPMGSGLAPGRSDTTLPRALPAATAGSRVSVLDVMAGSEELAEGVGRTGWNRIPDDADADEFSQQFFQSYKNAPIADGKFPVVILVHGLGGRLISQASNAEMLASQGYIAVVVVMTSDSSGPPIFEDPDNEWAQQASRKEIADAYRLIARQNPVFEGFARFLFDYDGSLQPYMAPGSNADTSKLRASKEGAIRSGNMMGELFEQRTEDVRQVIFELKKLNQPELACRVKLESERTRKDICGFFAGHIDVDNIGITGSSLGSMTSQSALSFLSDVDTAIGSINGMPRMWEPYGGLSGDPADEAPAGVPKPYLGLIGSDDYFVHSVFRGIHWTLFEAAGGDPTDNYPIPDEQPWPTADNPSPVALSAHNRAQAESMLIMFRDQGHGTSDFAGYFPGMEETGRRVPLSRDLLPEPYKVLGWVEENGRDIYLPRLMRNYFYTNWFDWQLKGDDAARQRVLNHPFENGVRLMREKGVSRD